MLDRLKIKSAFIDGLRVTDRETVGIVEMVLSGQINKQLVADIAWAGGRAVGMSGKDSGMIRVRSVTRPTTDTDSTIVTYINYGFVDKPTTVPTPILAHL